MLKLKLNEFKIKNLNPTPGASEFAMTEKKDSFQKTLLLEADFYRGFVSRSFIDLDPVERKTLDNLFRHLCELARHEQSARIFKTARALLADKMDYVRRRPGKNHRDALRMYVRAICDKTGYRKREF